MSATPKAGSREWIGLAVLALPCMRGLTNASIRGALVDLLGKPIGDATAVFVPTAMHAMPRGGEYLWGDLEKHRQIGWRQLSILELAAIPSMLVRLRRQMDVVRGRTLA